MDSKETGMTGTKYISVPIVSITFEFQFHGSFRSNLEKKTIALRKDPKYFIVNSKEKGMTSKISLSEESFDVTARKLRRGIWQCFETVLVCLCLFTSRTPLEVKRFLLVSIGQPSVVVATFLPKIGAFKLGSRLTHEPLWYISPQGSFPGNRNNFFLVLQRH